MHYLTTCCVREVQCDNNIEAISDYKIPHMCERLLYFEELTIHESSLLDLIGNPIFYLYK